MRNAGLFILALVVMGVGNNIVWRLNSKPHTCPLLSPVELQERIGVKPDGKIGKETMEAWDRAYSEQCGEAAMEPFVGEDGKLNSPRE